MATNIQRGNYIAILPENDAQIGTNPSGYIPPFSSEGLAFDNAGNLFVADLNGTNIDKFTTNGVQSTFATATIPSVVPGYLNGLAFDGAGNLFVTDTASTNIYKFTTNGVQSTFATVPSVGPASPAGLAFDSAGNLFVADSDGNIYKFTTNGMHSIFATLSAGPGAPYGLAFDSAGNLFVADGDGNIYKFTPDGAQSTFASRLLGPGSASLAFPPKSAVTPKFSHPIKSGAQFQFLVSGWANQNYTIQVSTNLSSTNWDSVLVINTPATQFMVIDPNATTPQRFYRILVGP